jgi:16S rRNA (uracil1498-N3)-methyltransferase
MIRLFVPPQPDTKTPWRLPEDSRHYLQRVLRLSPGAEIIVLDGRGGQYHARLTLLPDGEPAAEILQSLPPPPPPPLHLTLYQGLPRGKRWPLIIQKATELGASRLVPVLSARSGVKLRASDTESKHRRWQRIAIEAAEQCGVGTPPEIATPLSWEAALTEWQLSGQPGLLLDETLAGSAEQGLRATLQTLHGQRELGAFVGPEGGWAPGEAADGRQAGLQPVNLGPRILRTETAAVAICVAVMYELGGLA